MRRTLEVANRLGLHARAAAKLVRLASQFQSEILLGRKDGADMVDARSILGLLMLAARQDTSLVVSVSGVDESAAADAVEHLFAERFGEAE